MSEHPKRRSGRSTAAAVAMLSFALFCAVLFSALGVWQVQRLQWKLDLIERVEARVAAQPVAMPAPESPQPPEYLKVSATGHFLNDRETLTQAVTDLGGGYWVMTPFVTDGGDTVLVNRGFVTPQFQDKATRSQGLIEGPATLVGLLRYSEPRGGFLRSNDRANGRWFSRDVEAIAAARDLGPVAPYFVDADATANPGGWPVGGLTRIHFSNNHLVYALTWAGLALMSIGGVWYVLRDFKRRAV